MGLSMSSGDGSPVRIDDSLGDRKPEACPFRIPFRLRSHPVKHLEQFRNCLVRHPVVLNQDLSPTCIAPQHDANLSSSRFVQQGVPHDVLKTASHSAGSPITARACSMSVSMHCPRSRASNTASRSIALSRVLRSTRCAETRTPCCSSMRVSSRISPIILFSRSRSACICSSPFRKSVSPSKQK